MSKNPSLLTPHSSLSLKAPAKINWFLKVIGLRGDGFHEIQSLIQKVTLYDILTIRPAKDLVLKTSRSVGTIPTTQNLVYKAARLLRERCGVKSGAHIYLMKHIPVSAGLGGGSSDAAAALIGLNKLWGLNLSHKEIAVYACELGSDVPFFLDGPLAFIEGRGEKITTIKINRQLDILIVKPPVTVSTAWAFNSYKLSVMSNELKKRQHSSLPLAGLTKKEKKPDNIKLFIKNLEKAGLQLPEGKNILNFVPSVFSNDLEAPVVRRFPVIAEIKRGLLEEGAMFSMMSGSGAAVFGVFESAEKARNASKVFKDCWTAVVKTLIE